MERKLAAVLFVDLVDSTGLVAGSDPEVVRRRVTEYFERVSRAVRLHGGVVEKFAGDAVLAAFGIPQAHEDDAQRAVRAALAIRREVDGLGLRARLGIEAGEVVVESADSTFATGEAVNLAARLQQAARPGEVLLGPTAYRLAAPCLVVEDAGLLDLRGLDGPVRARRVLDVLEGAGRPPGPRAPLVGREAERTLLATTFERVVRDRRAHLFTVYGEPGVGKSRLVREFVDGLERATVLVGRALPYGEGVTYWPLAEMVKAAAGITDDEPFEQALRKLRECCAEEVADILGLASGLMGALEAERSPQEIAWAAGEVMRSLAEVQPLVLVFEDIHWAEPPLLDLIEHLADAVRAPLLILCLARPELLEARPGWSGGRVRATSIELQPLSEAEAGLLVKELLGVLAGTAGEAPPPPRDVLERTGGNPLFVEETIRMLAEGGEEAASRIPDTLQALIAARIDHLPPSAKALLQQAAVIGRVFWRGALERLAPDVDGIGAALDDLLQREFLLREARSSISGETAFRFKHLLIREVAYAGLAKLARAQYHARFAEWLAERTGDELVEIRAYHLDQAVEYLVELEGAAPPELVREATGALLTAAKRALARESYGNARRLALRAAELRPTLAARYTAARAAWRLQDWAAVQAEMSKVREQAREEGEVAVEALALAALAEARLKRDGEVEAALELADGALGLLGGDGEPAARLDALMVRATVAGWQGRLDEVVAYMERAYELAMETGRRDVQAAAAQVLAQTRIVRLELDEAELLVQRALELAGESGSLRARVSSLLTYGWLLTLRGELDAAEELLEEVRASALELGVEPATVVALLKLGALARVRGDLRRSEKLLREALRITTLRGDRGILPDVHAALAETLAGLGRLEEGERLALEARAGGPAEDIGLVVASLRALAAVRAAQGRAAEAESLLLDALAHARERGFAELEVELLRRLAALARERGAEAEAAAHERRLAELAAAAAGAARSAARSAAPELPRPAPAAGV